MANAGGIGAFAKGFADSFAAGVNNRRMRDQVKMREDLAARRQAVQEEQFGKSMEFRQQAQDQLQEYRANQQALQEKHIELQKKQGDLQVMGALSKAFDPKIPKAQRMFILKQTGKQLGIDPKSQDFKDFQTMVSGLEDEDLSQTRSSLMTLLPEASPGQITALTTAIMNGQMTFDKALEGFSELKKNKLRSSELSGLDEQPAAATPGSEQAAPGSRLLSPEPIATQAPGSPQGGNLPVPGMPNTAAAQPVQGTDEQKVAKLRKAAVEFMKNGMREDANVTLQLARDIEGGKKLELKVVADPNSPTGERYVTEEQALGQPAPGTRPVRSPAEEAAVAEQKGFIEQDMKKIEPISLDAANARAMEAPLQAFKAANNSGQFTPGTAGGLRESIARAGEFLGVSPEILDSLKAAGIGDAPTAELMDSASAQIATQLADRMSRVTNMSLAMIQSAVPGLTRTKEGNNLIIDMAEKTNERALALDNLLERYKTQYGTLRPKGKPTFFEAADKLRREPILDKEFLDKVTKEAKRGAGVDTKKLIEKARGKEVFTYGDMNFDITGKTDKGLNLLRLKNGQSYPAAATEEEFKKLPAGEFLWLDPVKGPHLRVKQ